MTKPNASLVTQGKPKVGGAVFKAPLGTALPTDATSALPEAWIQLGYVADSGVTNTISIESANQKAWGGDVVLNGQTSKTDEIKFKLIESLNPEVLKVVFGEDNVSGSLEDGITVHCKPLQTEAHAFVFDMIQKGGILKRIVVPEATVTAIGDIVYKDDEAVGYDLTMGAVPDESGDTHAEYIAKPAAGGGA
ncbi:phage tail protein [Faecalibaculum rodentium]|uniref:phage tail tube protein n=1 Tax=Faecalibaculum rodentium TaxID=1702221 RepID=UPI0023F4D1A1|nr:phage tail protein [Faecalibaculum rodentium]